MARKCLLVCCAFLCLVPIEVGLSMQAVKGTERRPIDLARTGRRPEAINLPRGLFFGSGGWQAKKMAVRKGDNLITEGNMDTNPRESSSEHAMKWLSSNMERGSEGNRAALTAEVLTNEAFASQPSERAEIAIEELPSRQEIKTVLFSLASLSERGFIDRKETTAGKGEGKERRGAQFQLLPSPVKQNRPGNMSLLPSQTNSTFAIPPSPARKAPNTKGKPTLPRHVLFPAPYSSIFPKLESRQRSRALSSARGISENDGQILQQKGNENLKANGGVQKNLAVSTLGLHKSDDARMDELKSDLSALLVSPGNIGRSEMPPTLHSDLNNHGESDPPLPPSRKSGRPQDSTMVSTGESIRNSTGVSEVPAAVSERRFVPKDGQREVKVFEQSPIPRGQYPTPTRPRLTSPTNVILTRSIDVIDLNVEGERGRRGGRSRVRREVQSYGEGEGGGANVTTGTGGLNGSAAGESNPATVNMTSSLSSVTNTVTLVSSSQTFITAPDTSQETATSDGSFIETTSVLTTTITANPKDVHQSSSSKTADSSSASPSTMTSRETTEAAETPSSSKLSSDDVVSPTNIPLSTSSMSSITPAAKTSQTMGGSFASSTVSVTGASTTKSTSTEHVVLEVTSESDTNEVQPITTVGSMTSLFSKLGSSSTAKGNEVSATDTSHGRTARSTQSSSPSIPATSPTTVTNSTTTTTATSTESTPSDSTPSESPSASSSPPAGADPPSTQLTPKDVFGDLWTSDPEPEGLPYPEPGDKGNKTGEEEDEEPVSEPGPDWDMAKMVWQGAWEVHLYVFACLFACLGVYTLVCVIRLWRIHRLLSRRYFVSLNLLMLLLCVSRAVYLFVDGYNSNGTFHPSVDYFFYSISFPCLTSAFSIQLYALLQATKMQFLPPTIQKMSLLVTIVVFHFVISLVTDVIVGMYAGMQIVLFVCQLFFILWGLFLFFGYAYIFRRLYLHAVKRQKNVMVQQQQQQQLNGSGGGGGSANNVSSSSGRGLVKPRSKFTLSVAVKVTFSTAILGLVTVGLEVYGVVGVYKNFSDERPEPWPWYVYHTALRLVEFLMAASMCYVASQPFRYRKGRQACCCPVLCAPCAEIFCCGADVNRSDMQAAWSELDHHQLRASLDRGPPHHVSLDQDQCSGNGLAHRGSKSSQRGGGGDLTVTAKARIYFSDQDDVRPIVSSQPGSRPTSATSETLENRTVTTGESMGGEGSGDLASPEKRPTGSHTLVTTSTPLKTSNGVVNTAYMPTVDDPRPQSPGFKSRKSSIASSEYFLAASVSLADSMASELDKAFRSMHDEDPRQASLSSLSGQSQDLLEKAQQGPHARTFPDSAIQRFLHQHPGEAPNVNVLRRSRSAFGRSSFYDSDDQKREEEDVGGRAALLEPGGAWHQKLFRSRSDNLGGIRTKDVAKATYMSLLDIEQQNLQQDTSAHPRRADSIDTNLTADSTSESHNAVPIPSFRQTETCADRRTSASASSKNNRLENGGETYGPSVSVSNNVRNSPSDDQPPRSQSPSHPTRDVNGVMTSAQAPYRTVISVGGKGSFRDSESAGEGGSNLPSPSHSTTPSFSPSPFSPPPFSGSPSLFRSGLMSSPHGLMGYGNVLDDEEDDIEV